MSLCYVPDKREQPIDLKKVKYRNTFADFELRELIGRHELSFEHFLKIKLLVNQQGVIVEERAKRRHVGAAKHVSLYGLFRERRDAVPVLVIIEVRKLIDRKMSRFRRP
jgi:hypothetical protein